MSRRAPKRARNPYADPIYTTPTEARFEPTFVARPLRLPCECRHPGVAALVLGGRMRDNGRSEAVTRLCMDCGDNSEAPDAPAWGLALAMQEFGWSREIGLRLHALVSHRRNEIDVDDAPLWIRLTLRDAETSEAA